MERSESESESSPERREGGEGQRGKERNEEEWKHMRGGKEKKNKGERKKMVDRLLFFFVGKVYSLTKFIQ